ncbi:formate dehydrogenase accessory sulfurtransferase FdhD [Tenacibaculum sp. 1B UA]|uniref:formate dehydrogenase accessory sulfurtransferase FdhD n=1 Tax=unclassified Tenacibaculum TaxID=2635139 RepID=UPI0026E4961E|nr:MULTISPECIES: formate dehydrogenase accessory sulfurtransferase FdhD [unclassified Tenacibaculum]MDO6675568.1 formate dehydrogenase accessory sulfurtransferase FdhD [Tenacibaculum sp. 1_MG-2023]MDX8553001.1 formate dehydrogenase accessory sulfurtransferase FdhD [Tenacibaculum sp. 1B UA]
MKQTESYQSIKLSNNSLEKFDDTLVVEAPLQININKEPYTVVMRTPGNDEELVRGLLYAEDIYKKKDGVKVDIIKTDKDFSTVINMEILKEKLGKGYLNKRTLLSVSSCGICGKKELKDLKVKGKTLKSNSNEIIEDIVEATSYMFMEMSNKQIIFKSTGGSHACAIFNSNKKLLTIKEDIGRHNAVDKCVGDLISQNKLKEANYMLVSGRVSYEIVSKAFLAKIPIIIAVSACSSLAVDFAKEFGIFLIGFSRNNKMTIYSTPHG